MGEWASARWPVTPHLDIDCSLFDEDGESLGPDKVGEIILFCRVAILVGSLPSFESWLSDLVFWKFLESTSAFVASIMVLCLSSRFVFPSLPRVIAIAWGERLGVLALIVDALLGARGAGNFAMPSEPVFEELRRKFSGSPM